MPTILVIDDDATNREPTGRLLRSSGYDIFRAANGRDALDLLQMSRIDLILLDVLMPEMDGLTFLQMLRDGPYRMTPVVMITGLTDGEAFQRAQKLGVDEYLIKARFSAEQLISVVGEQIERREEESKSAVAKASMR